MKNIDQSIIKSLDGKDIKLIAYIPYLLQDLWEIGSSPQAINHLLKKNNCLNINSKVLDLGCGKGAVSINIAREFECHIHGIDAMPEFIEEAEYWADKYHQNNLCTFEVADIRKWINDLREFDLIVLGSIGPVLGNIKNSLKSVGQCLNKEGFVVLDDGYIPEKSNFENENYLKQCDAEQQIKNAGFGISDAFVMDDSFIEESDNEIYDKIEIRAQELMQKYPANKHLFEEYLQIQRIENDILENKLECVTWLLKKKRISQKILSQQETQRN